MHMDEKHIYEYPEKLKFIWEVNEVAFLHSREYQS